MARRAPHPCRGLPPYNADLDLRANCYSACPDDAITKLGPGKGFVIDYDYGKGCGPCVAECPCGAIEMIPEESEGEQP